MADVLACIDHSAYANGVCDHAAWFASDPDVGVEVLHVETSSGAVPDGEALDRERVSTRQLVDRSVARLHEEGVGPLSSASVAGSFVEIATQRGAAVIVMGKHGEGSAAERHSLGSNVEAMLRATSTPICLTAKLFLPIHRAVVLLDADTSHRTAVEFVVSQARLSPLPTDIVVVAATGDVPDPKVTWARSALGEPAETRVDAFRGGEQARRRRGSVHGGRGGRSGDRFAGRVDHSRSRASTASRNVGFGAPVRRCWSADRTPA